MVQPSIVGFFSSVSLVCIKLYQADAICDLLRIAIYEISTIVKAAA